MNVDPYQSNRVRLKVPEGLNDYINASPVELTSSKSGNVLRYIATQVSSLQSLLSSGSSTNDGVRGPNSTPTPTSGA